VLWPRVTGKKKDPDAMRDALKKAHVVFVSGGDVEEGMRVLTELDLVGAVRASAKRGAVCVGISAGAIMLGDRWIRWPHAKATDDEAETFDCLEIAPVTLDTHGEKDGWGEIRSYVAVRARETKKTVTGYGIPSGGCLRVTQNAHVSAHGEPAQAFRAKPGATAEALDDVPAR
ncbi:MAG TPA: Type 1 glutamine amidotransferase-like domain-containing protein, partial [bacterium]|nr:Type 1 glutamine amidotransferase-like domain-containing protein [bacterium]